ncbi:hypothetical protein LguiB_021703 [Lonicera macranthoides]
MAVPLKKYKLPTGIRTVELRADIVYTVANIGGHLSASLGVVELAVAYVTCNIDDVYA